MEMIKLLFVVVTVRSSGGAAMNKWDGRRFAFVDGGLKDIGIDKE